MQTQFRAACKLDSGTWSRASKKANIGILSANICSEVGKYTRDESSRENGELKRKRMTDEQAFGT